MQSPYILAEVGKGFHCLLDALVLFVFQCITSPRFLPISLWSALELRLLFFSVKLHFLGDVTQYHQFQIHPYISFSQMYLSSLKMQLHK